MYLLNREKHSKEIGNDGNNVENDDENGLLSCGIYSFPAAARLFLLRLGRRSLPRSLDTAIFYTLLNFLLFITSSQKDGMQDGKMIRNDPYR